MTELRFLAELFFRELTCSCFCVFEGRWWCQLRTSSLQTWCWFLQASTLWMGILHLWEDTSSRPNVSALCSPVLRKIFVGWNGLEKKDESLMWKSAFVPLLSLSRSFLTSKSFHFSQIYHVLIPQKQETTLLCAKSNPRREGFHQSSFLILPDPWCFSFFVPMCA